MPPVPVEIEICVVVMLVMLNWIPVDLAVTHPVRAAVGKTVSPDKLVYVTVTLEGTEVTPHFNWSPPGKKVWPEDPLTQFPFILVVPEVS